MARSATYLAVVGAGFLTGLLLLLPRSAAAGDFRAGAAENGALMLGPERSESALLLRSWAPDGHSSESSPPRLSGLSLTFPERGSAESGAGVGLEAPRAFGVMGEDVGVSVGAGVSPRASGLVPQLSSAFDQAGIAGRVSLHHLSLGGAFIGSRPNPALAFGPPGDFAGGHDVDVSYSFDSGSVSLSHTQGADLLGLNEIGGQSVAVTGRYLLGHNMDMTALFALEGEHNDDPIQAALAGFALRAGLRLSF